MIKVLLDESCFDKNGFVIFVTIIDAILQAAGTERVKVRGNVGRLWMYRTWSPPSEAERWNVNAEYALIEKINVGVKSGILKPFDSNTLERKGYGDIAGAVVSLEELNAWGAKGWLYEFERAQEDVDDQSAETKPSNNEEPSTYVQPSEEPPMKVGRNKRADCKKWFAYMAYKVDGVTREERAGKIKEEADRRHYLPEKADEISIDMIISAIPKGATGTRQDNRKGGKSASGR